MVFLNGTFMPKSQAWISPDDRGFLFADGIYDVIRSVNGRLFEAEAHLERLARNAADLELRLDNPSALLDVAERLLRDNGLRSGDAAVYMQVTRGAAKRAHAYPDPPVSPTIYVTVFQFERRRRWHSEGIAVLTVPDTRWARCDIKSVSLLPNVMAADRAHAAGADEAVFVRDGVVLEGAHSSFFAVIGGEVATAPLSNYVLPGITRAVVLKLARAEGIPTTERPIFEHEIPAAEELFLTGTTTDVAPIVRWNGTTVGSGTPGSVARRLQGALFARLDAETG